MTVGFDQPLYVLSLDLGDSLQADVFGWTNPLAPEQIAQIAGAERVVYDAFTAAIAASVPKEKGAVLVDAKFGSTIAVEAMVHGYMTACAAERSGPDEFGLECGGGFSEGAEALHPTFWRVQVCCDQDGDAVRNRRQRKELRRLADHVRDMSQSRLMLDLVVSGERAQLGRLNGDRKAYAPELRPDLIVRVIQQMHDAEVEPDVWVIDGLDRREDCKKIVGAVRWGGRHEVGCLVRARGEDDLEVRRRLTAAASVHGFIGFVGGRTIVWGPLAAWRAGKIAREAAVAEIARRYRELVDIFEDGRPV
jgi:5-dehydro-2-deoxygluconokinase